MTTSTDADCAVELAEQNTLAPFDSIGRWHLARHVYACLADDHVVLLDLKRDKYYALGDPAAAALAKFVQGWPSSSAARNVDQDDMSCVVQTLADLESVGVVYAGTVEIDDRLRRDGRRLPRAQAALIYGYTPVAARIHMRDLVAFLRALAIGYFFKLRRSMHAMAARMLRTTTAAYPSTVEEDTQQCRELVGKFLRMRPWFYSAYQECLFDSFVLIEFLSQYGVFPRWVIGVKTGPFEAHCWVQSGTVVLNDTPERVTSLTPILVS